MEPDEVELEDDELEVEVPLRRLASDWKAAKLFGPLSTALIEKTMPEPQCPVCPQKPQMGAV